MNKIENYLEEVKTVGITGHRRPDGDCIGSCLGLYNYLTKNYPELSVSLYLESIADKFVFLKNSDKIIFNTEKDEEFDLFIVLDSSDLERIGETVKYFDKAKKTLCIDHHISNNNFDGEIKHINKNELELNNSFIDHRYDNCSYENKKLIKSLLDE